MRIVIHHTGSISSGTELALAHERVHHRTNEPPYRPDPLNFDVEQVFCKGAHDYGDSLKQLWDRGEGFINLEHDVAPWPGALTEIWGCSANWCMVPIILHGARNETNFGCVKWNDHFLKITKGIWDKYPRNDVFDWRSLDTWFYQTMKEAKTRPHVHPPCALHFNWQHL